MRLTDHQTQTIRRLAREMASDQARVRVFGSRLDDTARGGDLDLMLELLEPVNNPALMAARMAAKAALIKPSHRRKPVPSALVLLDSGFRRNDDIALDQRFPKVSRTMSGRKVDVLLSALNLMRLPIHDIAFKEGQLL